MPGMNPRFADPSTNRSIDYGLQLPAMDRELWDLIAGVKATRFAPNLLTKTVGVDEFEGSDTGGVQRIEQAEQCQFFDGVRKGIDAHAEFANNVSLLIELAIHASGVQHQGRHQATNAATNNYCLHDPPAAKL